MRDDRWREVLDADERTMLIGVFEVSEAQVRDVVRQLSRRVAVPCRQISGPTELPLIRVPGREQVDGHRLLDVLKAYPRDDDRWLLGITDADIGNRLFTFFFGLGDPDDGVALVSTARLEQAYYGLPDDPTLTAHRTVMEILHELGHVAGLHHCADMACLMCKCTSVEVADNRGEVFCSLCAPELPPAFAPSCRR